MSVPGGYGFWRIWPLLRIRWQHGNAKRHTITADGPVLSVHLDNIRVTSQFSGGDREITKLQGGPSLDLQKINLKKQYFTYVFNIMVHFKGVFLSYFSHRHLISGKYAQSCRLHRKNHPERIYQCAALFFSKTHELKSEGRSQILRDGFKICRN